MPEIPDGTRILAGDIGGTKTNLAVVRLSAGPHGERLEVEREQRFASADFPSLAAIIHQFLGANSPRLACAGFGVPGPVLDGSARLTNLAWAVDSKPLAAEFGFPLVEVLNDVAANALGIGELQPSDFELIQAGNPAAAGNRCVVSPGTGLGEAGLFWDGRKHRVWACEGGHTDFAPRNRLECELLEYLQTRFEHVSVERVVSGHGMLNIYQFLRDTERGAELPQVAEAMQTGDPGRAISQFGDTGECPLCAETLHIFSSCLGAEAGNMALKTMAGGGVFLGGGIPGKMLDHLRGDAFLGPFRDKGRMSDLLEKIPVRVILNDQAALFGAARRAADALVEASLV